MPGRGQTCQRRHAERIDEWPTEQNREAEAPERRTRNPPDVGGGQPERTLEVAHDVAADRERHGSGDQCNATRPEQARWIHMRALKSGSYCASPFGRAMS